MARRWSPQTEAELNREIAEARRRSKIASATEPRATSARYNRQTGRLDIELNDGSMVALPTQAMQGLRDISPDRIAKVEIAGNGYALRWDDLDVDYTVPGLLAGRLGSKVWMREHARKAGSTHSDAKAHAARRNGRKGGRPRLRTSKS